MKAVDKAKCALLREALREDLCMLIAQAEIAIAYIDLPRPDDGGLLYALRSVVGHARIIAKTAMDLRNLRDPPDVITDIAIDAAELRREQSGEASDPKT